jgi:ferredoxin-NADP reductase
MGNRLFATGRWQFAAVLNICNESYRAKTYTLQLSDRRPFAAGQHFDVRLTAPDGYQAQRSYSIASGPERPGEIDLTVELIPDGEVSPFFHEVVRIGDELEVRGPVGGPFTWQSSMGGPLLLIAGGSGIVPIMSMLRHRIAAAPDLPTVLLYSSRSLDDVIFRSELEQMARNDPNLTVSLTLTRSRPARWRGYDRRVDGEMLDEIINILPGSGWTYICGPTPFVESVSNMLVDRDQNPEKIRTERFGPSG